MMIDSLVLPIILYLFIEQWNEHLQLAHEGLSVTIASKSATGLTATPMISTKERMVRITGLASSSVGLVLASPVQAPGVYVFNVIRGGLVDRTADVYVGDQILEINGTDVSSSSAGLPY